MILVTSTIPVVEVRGKEISDPEIVNFAVSSHWNNPDLVCVTSDTGTDVTVRGADLITAIENAMRTNRHA